MKANEAPEKIYISTGDAILDIYSKKESNEEVEYIRTDTFIEKACAWFRRIDYDDSIPPYETIEEFIKVFKNAMQGE